MQKNAWTDLLSGLLGMQNTFYRSAPQEQGTSQTDSASRAEFGKSVKSNQNKSFTKPNFDPLDYSQSAYIKLLKHHDEISKRIDADMARRGDREKQCVANVHCLRANGGSVCLNTAESEQSTRVGSTGVVESRRKTAPVCAGAESPLPSRSSESLNYII